MNIVKTVLALLAIVPAIASSGYAQQWDDSKLQKNKQATMTTTSGGMKFPYVASASSMAVQEEMAPPPAAQWNTSKLQPNIQANVTGRYGTPDFQYVAPPTPVFVPESVPAPETAGPVKKYGTLYLGEQEKQAQSGPSPKK
jgi:hypothetical protein